jgi:bacteriocin-like protein
MERIMSTVSNVDHGILEDTSGGGDNKEFIEMKEDELKQVTGGLKLPGLHKASDVTLKRGIIGG